MLSSPGAVHSHRPAHACQQLFAVCREEMRPKLAPTEPIHPMTTTKLDGWSQAVATGPEAWVPCTCNRLLRSPGPCGSIFVAQIKLCMHALRK